MTGVFNGNRRKTKILTLALVYTISFSMTLTACNNDTAEGRKNPMKTTAAEKALVVAPAGQYPIVNAKTNIRVFTNTDMTIENLETNATTKWLEKKTNVHLNWIVSEHKEAKNKLNIMLASGSGLPDVIMLANVTPIITDDQIFTYGAMNLFIPLNNLIEKYGINVKKGIAGFDGTKQQITAPDGNIYALPRLQDAYHTTMPEKFWINKVWLDKLGLKLPGTPDELYEVLKAFRDSDPNGNGKKDEIPLSGRKDLNSTLDAYLMNTFQYSPGFNGDNFCWMYLENGRVTFAPVQSGWQEGLRYMRKLYAEGLIDKEIFINTKVQLLALTGNTDGNRVGSFQMLHIGGAVDTSSKTAEEYVPVPPLKGPAGKIAPAAPLKQYPGFLITRDCRQPEVAFRLGDTIMTNPLEEKNTLEWMTLIFGPEGQGWEKAKPGTVGIDGKPALYTDLLVGRSDQNIKWGQIGPCVYPDALRNKAAIDPDKWSNEKSLYEATKNAYEPYKVNRTIPYMNYRTDDASQLIEPRANIQKYVNESISKFVTGTMDIDKDWDKYVKQLNDMGLQSMLELTQRTYDSNR